MDLVGEAGHTYRIKFWADLLSWAKLANVANPTGTLSVLDLEAGKHGELFYRAVRH
jgi:hypothetical protein